MEDYYRFRVGVTSISGKVKGRTPIRQLLNAAGVKHCCFLLNRDIFEYGPDGYVRRENVGREKKWDWDSIGELQDGVTKGVTRVSPDRLETAIENSHMWGEKTYIMWSHNCYDFVAFCINACR